jgi:hypothetical protein
MKAVLLALLLAVGPGIAFAIPTDRVVVKVRDADGQPVVGAHVLTIEGASSWMRQGIIWSDSNGVAVAEIGRDAYVGLRITAPGYETWRLDLAPGARERKGKVIEVRLSKRSRKGEIVPVSL